MDVKAFIQKHRPLLDIFSGSHEHDTTDGVWRDLLAFPAPLTRLPPVDLQVTVAPFCDQLGEPPAALPEPLKSCSSSCDTQPYMHAWPMRVLARMCGAEQVVSRQSKLSAACACSAQQCSHAPLSEAGAPCDGAPGEAGAAAASYTAGSECRVLPAAHCEAPDRKPERRSAGGLCQWRAPGKWLDCLTCACRSESALIPVLDPLEQQILSSLPGNAVHRSRMCAA